MRQAHPCFDRAAPVRLKDALALIDEAELLAMASGEIHADELARESLLARGIRLEAGLAPSGSPAGLKQDHIALGVPGCGEVRFPELGVAGQVQVVNGDQAVLVTIDVDGSPDDPLVGVLAAAASLVGDLRPADGREVIPENGGVCFLAIKVDGQPNLDELAGVIDDALAGLEGEDWSLIEVSSYGSLGDLQMDAPDFSFDTHQASPRDGLSGGPQC